MLSLATCAACFSCGSKKPDPEGPAKDTGLSGNQSETETVNPYTEPLQEVIVKGRDGSLSVRFCRADLIHFRYAPDDVFPKEEAFPGGIEKSDDAYEPVTGEVEEGEKTVQIRTVGLSLSVDRDTLAVSIQNPDGSDLFRSGSVPFSHDGGSRKASFVRDVRGTEHFYGLGNVPGDDFLKTDHRDSVFDLWMFDDNVHAVIPLWYSTAGYGVFVNNSNRGSVSFKKDYSLSLEGGEMDFYFLSGTGKQILSHWSELVGRMAMPPLYALGLTYRGFKNWNEDQLYAAVAAQVKAGISIDVVGVEPGWQTATYPCTYAWNPAFTSDPEAFVERMHEAGLRVNLWEHPYVSPKAACYEALLPYSLKSEDIGTREWEGHSGKYAFGGIVPDLTLDEAREIYWQLQDDNLASIGIDGYKIDETDSWGASASLDLRFPGGLTNNAYHNLLGTLTSNLMHEKYKEEYGLRTFIFSRGNFTGMQRYATTAYTDYYGFDQFVMSVVTQAFSGTYYTPEIRDTSTHNDVEYMRRTQLMFLTPFAMSNEWATEASVLGRSRSVVDCYKHYNRLHYELIPYMYSLFWQQHQTGIGVVRPLYLEFEEDEKARGIDNQFMLGDAFLVCPVSGKDRVATVKIYLPSGCRWMDFNTGYEYEGGQTIDYTCAASTLPLFVRMGSVIPLGSFGRNTGEVTDRTLKLDLYPDAGQGKKEFVLFEDDGITYGYEKGVYAQTAVSLQTVDGITCEIGPRSGLYRVEPRMAELRFHYRARPTSVEWNGKALPEVLSYEALSASEEACWFFDEKAELDIDKIVYVRIPEDGKGATIRLTVPAKGTQTLPGVFLDGTQYEFEAASGNLTGKARVSAKETASGHAVVSQIGNGDGGVVIGNVQAPADGLYEAEIIFFNGGEDTRVLSVCANGKDTILLNCFGNGNWEEPVSVTVPVSLKKGANTLAFSVPKGRGYGPDLDCVIVYDREAVRSSMSGTVLEAGSGTVLGNLKLENSAAATGGKSYSGFGSSDYDSVTYRVSVPSEGPYQLNLNYANPAFLPVALELIVNEAKSEIMLPTTCSADVFALYNRTVYLRAGENTITFGCAGGELKYECENGGEYQNCNSKLAPRDGYVQSGGYAVGASANNGKAFFTMKGIQVPKDGTYKVVIYAASGDERTFRLKVNGNDTGELYRVRTGHFHKFGPLQLELDLRAGDNSLTFWAEAKEEGEGDTEWMPNFDYILLPELSQENELRLGAISVE
ncbi:MAG: DUF5110 domain-containing protein [Clostridia bacterium]|nr:DUF5110 domain-containing protein [Clostridia bacterium]